jgi:anti-sigma factor RsiW
MHPSDLHLGDYVDDSLDAGQRAAVSEHLVGCRACQALVADFSEVRRAAAALGTIEPPERTWAQIERRLERTLRTPSVDNQQSASQGRAEAGHAVRRWPWLAAAAALVLATAGGVWLVRPPLGGETAAATDTTTAQAVEAELAQAAQHYEKAISGLEQIANAEKGALDPRTAATLQENMGVVDQAIDESRAALNAEPASDPARRSLLDSFKAKIELLQNTIALINDMRTGDDAGAAQAISRLKRGK